MSTDPTPQKVPILVPEFDKAGQVIHWYKFYIDKKEVDRMRAEVLESSGRAPDSRFTDTKTNIAQPKPLWPFLDAVVIDLEVPGTNIDKMKQKVR